MARLPFVPESQASQQEIEIVPQCIFCHQPTDHVETRVIKKRSEQRWSSTQVLRTTTTHLIPFPAHHRCYRRRWLAQRITAILTGVTMGLALAANYPAIYLKPGGAPTVPRAWMLPALGLVLVALLLMFTSLGLWIYLNAKAERYAKEHAGRVTWQR